MNNFPCTSKMLSMEDLAKQIKALGIIPVVAINAEEHALRVAEALLHGGLPCIEVTFRTSAAEESIRRIAVNYPAMILGAGTVLTIEQAKKAVDAGASFIVSPGFSPDIVTWCQANSVPVIPGVATPTEIMMALATGVNIVKFFPAETLGGVKTLEAIAAPFHEVQFIPTGGITAQNLATYLKHRSVLACGGSWLATPAMISSEKFGEITALTKEAIALVKTICGEGTSQ
ncbi:MAG: bifunctional 4-hydroxy-2-oxoglutarate aldolase/2-dehydro-3-deoxy-phosphogluconate aldolase [Chloroflexota bacterium]